MSGTKALRNRIKSVKSTQKITKAMRMVSAAKLYRAKNSVTFASIYRDKILDILSAAKKSLDQSDITPLGKVLLSSSTEFKNTLIIIYGSDRGLCGGYNGNIFKKLRKDLTQYKNPKILVLGNKMRENVEKITKPHYFVPVNNKPDEISKSITEIIVKEIEEEESTQVITYYTKFKNTLVQIPSSLRIIPAEEHSLSSDKQLSVEFEGDNLFERVIKLYLDANLVTNLFESKASEEASRMTAMDNATKNAGEMIQKLTLKMNRTRQAHITKELIEVISGAEAV